VARRTVQAGYLGRQIEALRGRGLTRGQIAAQTGIGERTQRKLLSGETPGTRVYRRIIPQGMGRATRRGVDIPRSAEPGHFSIVVRKADGSYARVPVILRDYERATHLTVFDKARIVRNDNIQSTITDELQKQRAGSPPMSKAEIEASTIVDVVPIIHSYTANIPWVELV
jgi:hypothetical protein